MSVHITIGDEVVKLIEEYESERAVLASMYDAAEIGQTSYRYADEHAADVNEQAALILDLFIDAYRQATT